ncbi:MAG: GNAT family N-acetyltransferase [Polyangia bacterium]
MITLRPILASDADPLYPLLAGTAVPDTLLWDGPDSLDEYREAIATRASQAARGEIHMFAIATVDAPIGTLDVRPENDFRGDMGLWIGHGQHGRGYGTEAVRLAARYAFERVGLQKLEATVFVGNDASRRIFEKNGFQLEGTIRRAVRKRGRFVDEWLFGLLREELGRD